MVMTEAYRKRLVELDKDYQAFKDEQAKTFFCQEGENIDDLIRMHQVEIDMKLNFLLGYILALEEVGEG